MKEFEREGVNPNFEIKSSYDKILDYVQEIISYDFAVLYRVNEKTEKLEVVAKRGDAVELLEEIKFRFGEGLSAWVAEWKKPILLTKKKDDDSGICVGSFLSFPLWAYGKLIGVMSLGHRKPSGFGLKELKLCRLFSERIALLMEKVNFITDLKETYNSLYKSVTEFERFYENLVKKEQKSEDKGLELYIKSKINNPLSVIIGNAELLLKEIDGSKGELRKRLETIIMESQKLSQFVSQNTGEKSGSGKEEDKLFRQSTDIG